MTTPVMTTPDQAPSPPPSRRAIELVLAHLHLKLGSLSLARVELETLAGLGGLDAGGLVDLAEVRWRTGDLLGAGEAAAAALRTDDADPVALIVAAEAASAIGRPSEARRLATRAVAAAPDSIDAIFAGMPRSGVWAPDANEPAPTAPTLFDRGPELPAARAPITPAADVPEEARPARATGPMTLGLWEGDEAGDEDAAAGTDPAKEFEAGRTALVAGSFDEAALRLGLALRLAPALAPAVLEATEGARASSLSVVRGDAYRLAGHEAEARQAYAIAARGGLPERRSKVRVRPKPAPLAVVAVEPDLEALMDATDQAAESERAAGGAGAAGVADGTEVGGDGPETSDWARAVAARKMSEGADASADHATDTVGASDEADVAGASDETVGADQAGASGAAGASEDADAAEAVGSSADTADSDAGEPEDEAGSSDDGDPDGGSETHDASNQVTEAAEPADAPSDESTGDEAEQTSSETDDEIARKAAEADWPL